MIMLEKDARLTRDKRLTMAHKIRITILEDHQSIVDGYLYRLKGSPRIEVVATIAFAEALEATLAEFPTDVLLLDVGVPTSPDNPNPYPIVHTIPQLLDMYPGLNILVISMHTERRLIQAVMGSGASGYILKDDQTMIRDLGNVIISVASGEIVLSHTALDALHLHDGSTTDPFLSPRQLEVLSLCAAYPDLSTAELAQKISTVNSTVRNLLSSAYLRLGVHTRLAAVTKARQLGLISPISASLPESDS